MSFPTPGSVDKIRSFLGLTGYYRQFIKGYADIANPLVLYLRKMQHSHGGPDQQQAFQTLKIKPTSSPVLIFLDYSKEFMFCTDASDIRLKNLKDRLARWFVTLQNYEVNFEYITEKKNTAADTLS